jgi:hypothetical protein
VTADGAVPWSALPTWPSVPPLAHGLVRWAVAGRESVRTVTVHSPLEITSRDAVATACLVTLPDGTSHRISCTLVDGVCRGSYADTAQRGVYRAEFTGAAQAAPQLLAVNIDARESDLSRVSEASLPDAFWSEAEAQPAATAATGPTAVPLFRYLLAAVAALLLAESGLACWLARRTA